MRWITTKLAVYAFTSVSILAQTEFIARPVARNIGGTAPPKDPRYLVVDLGKDMQPLRIANNGWVLLKRDVGDHLEFYRWKGGALELLTCPEPGYCFAADMNDSGVVVGGFSYASSETETISGMRWEPDSAVGVKVSSPIAALPNIFNELPTPFTSPTHGPAVKAAYFTSIAPNGDVFGTIYTGGLYLYSSLNLNAAGIYNGYKWPTGATSAPTALSDAHNISSDDGSDSRPIILNWTGTQDTIKRANTSGRYIGSRIYPGPPYYYGLYDARFVDALSSGMVDGSSVTFYPEDVNEAGDVVAGSEHGLLIWNGTETRIGSGNPYAINDAKRKDIDALGNQTEAHCPQILGRQNDVLTLWEKTRDRSRYIPNAVEDLIAENSGWKLATSGLTINDLNDQGAIVGYGSYRDPSNANGSREGHGYLLIPAKMMVDANRDGEMSFTEAVIEGKDGTSKKRPYRFWLNNDHDIFHTVDGSDTEYDDAGDGLKDSSYTSIYTERDLEDFTRLRISFKGLTDLVKNSEYGVYLEWRSMDGATTLPASEGEPEVRVYQERQPGVRPLYLEDETVASDQRATSGGIPYDTWIGGTQPGQPMDLFGIRPQLRAALSEASPNVNLLFCGKTAGRGQLILTIKKGPQPVAQYPPVYIELLDIKDMYERWTVGDGAGASPEVLSQLSIRAMPSGYAPQGHSRPFAYNSGDPEEKQYVLYVHGWNMKPEEKDQFAETAYKRLFWQGYRGRFGVFQWPTTYGFGALLADDKNWKNGVNGIYSAVTDPTNYDRGEWSAWRSALALKRLFSRINIDYPGSLYVMAHSMGNVVAGEALRIAAQEGSGQLVNTYVASQGAVPAHCYDGNLSAPLDAQVPAEILVKMLDGGHPETADVYGDWLSANATAVGRRINFYNVNDYALWRDVWQLNQYLKPDHSDPPDLEWSYRYVGNAAAAPVEDGFRKGYYDPSNPGQDIHLHLGDATDVKNRYEIISFAAESRSKALGAVSGVTTITDNFDLQSIWPPDTAGAQRPYSAHKWHSGQFRSTNMRQRDYWKSLLGPQGFNLNLQQP